MFLKTRDNQDALGAMSDRVQTNFAGVRVVRSFALEQRGVQGASSRSTSDYLEKSLAIARMRGSMAP